MSRFTLGPTGSTTVAVVDVPVVLVSTSGPSVTVSVPPPTGPSDELPSAVHVAFLSGPPAPGLTAAQVWAAATLYTTIPVGGPGTLSGTVPNAPAGAYFVQIIPEYPV